jgi:hypothetical protein
MLSDECTAYHLVMPPTFTCCKSINMGIFAHQMWWCMPLIPERERKGGREGGRGEEKREDE